jgi:hypothetical protein
MRIDLALLGDYALVDKMDKLTVAGIFRAVFGASFPFTRAVIYLVLVLTAEAGDGSDHHLVVRMIDPDGRELIPELHAGVQVERQDPNAEATMNVVLELNGIRFAIAGPHCFDIFVDERFVERVLLDVGQLRVANPS